MMGMDQSNEIVGPNTLEFQLGTHIYLQCKAVGFEAVTFEYSPGAEVIMTGIRMTDLVNRMTWGYRGIWNNTHWCFKRESKTFRI
jgi:hypothetical protein